MGAVRKHSPAADTSWPAQQTARHRDRHTLRDRRGRHIPFDVAGP